MSNKKKLLLVCFYFFLFSVNAYPQTRAEIKPNSLEVSLEKTSVNQDRYLDLLAQIAYKEVINLEFDRKYLDSKLKDSFWLKLKELNLDLKAELQFLKPIFLKEAFTAHNTDPHSQIFTYEVDSLKFQNLIDFVSLGHDPALKTIYILSDINLSKELSWNEVGVSSAVNFTGVIQDSWKKWAIGHFKKFPQVILLDKEFSSIPASMNAESVTIRWSSTLKKSEVFQDRRSARFELISQYVLVSTINNQVIHGLDFPSQKKELSVSNPKSLSSSLASLIYNLLLTQGSKLVAVLDQREINGTQEIFELKMTGKHGLYDLTLVNNFLNEKFKDYKLTSQVKSYDSIASTLLIKSSIKLDKLKELLAVEGGKFELNEQKILVFSSTDQSFAIIPK